MAEFNTVFANFDFSPSYELINHSLSDGDIEIAKAESAKVLNAQDEIKQSTKAIGGTVIFENGTNLIVNVPYDKALIDSMANSYMETIGTMANVGVGKTAIESHSSVAAIRGAQRGHIIIYSSNIKEDLVANFTLPAEATGVAILRSQWHKLAVNAVARLAEWAFIPKKVVVCEPHLLYRRFCGWLLQFCDPTPQFVVFFCDQHSGFLQR